MSSQDRVVIGGVDTHKDVHVAAVIDARGQILATASFAATAKGYRQLLGWLRSFGELAMVGVEGTGAYGAGLARLLAAEGARVVEVNRPNRQARRRRGKSDTADAEAAARAVLSGEASGTPKSADGGAEALRALRVARRSAVKARTQAGNQIGDLIVTAPQELRDKLTGLGAGRRVAACTALRPGATLDPVAATKRSLRLLARRHQMLSAEIDELDAAIAAACADANRALLSARGVGPDVASALLVAAGDNPERMQTEGSFAALCGVSPVEASSGKITRHRLNREATARRTTPYGASQCRGWPAIRPPERMRHAAGQRVRATRRSCAASSDTSPGKCSGCSPIPRPCPTRQTCDVSGPVPGSLWPARLAG